MRIFDYEEAIIAAAKYGHVALVQDLLQRAILPNNRAIVISEAAFAVLEMMVTDDFLLLKIVTMYKR